jgi:copper chaperone
MDRITMKIDGMSCGHCVSQVAKALTGIEGVQVEQVQVGSATVAFDPAAASEERIAQAIEDEGYAVASTVRA